MKQGKNIVKQAGSRDVLLLFVPETVNQEIRL